VSAYSYLLGWSELLVIWVGIGFAAYRARRWLLPGWSASPARLAEVVLGLSLFVLLSQVLGSVGLFAPLPLVLSALAVAIAASIAIGADSGPPVEIKWAPPRKSSLAVTGLATAVCIVSAAKWVLGTEDVLSGEFLNFDSMWYHLPLAAGFVQTGSLTDLHPLDPVDLNWFFPANAELFHAAGMATLGRDVLMPVVNLAWLGLALLGAWCVGRVRNVGSASVAGVATLLAVSVLVPDAGSAKNDVMALALLLASAAILVNGYASGPPPHRLVRGDLGPLIVAGLGAGLAVGTRLNMLVPVLVMAGSLTAIADRGSRRTVAAAWTGAVLATGGFWYVRNLLAIGNPLPELRFSLGPVSLPGPEHLELRPGFSMAHYLTDLGVWGDYFLPGLGNAFGDLWFLLLALALAGMVGGLADRRTPVIRALAVAALAGVLAHVVTPHTAGGFEGEPERFGPTLRYLAPVLAVGLALLPTVGPAKWARPLLLPVFVVLVIVTAGVETMLEDPFAGWAIALSAGAAAAVLSAVALVHRRLPSRGLGLLALGAVLLGIGAYWYPAVDYLRVRYSPNSADHLGLSASWAARTSNARIAVAGTLGASFQYGYYGNDISNRVIYLGRSQPYGGIAPFETCAGWRHAVNGGEFDFVVTTPTLGPQGPLSPGFAPERSWSTTDPALTEIVTDGPVSVYRVDGRLKPAGCAEIKDRFTGIPPLLYPAD
jgi:hypothetical protein